MTISGNISSKTFTCFHAGLPSVDTRIQNAPLEADNAVWPFGLVMGRNADGNYFPYGEQTVQIGTGDGSETDFTAQIGPIEPGTASIVAGSVTLTDDGCGNLTGTGGSGALNYQTGKVTVSFSSAVSDGDAVNLTCYPDPVRVLDVETDTSASSSAMAVRHGAVSKADLKVGVSSPAAAADTVCQRLEINNIVPV